MQTDLVSLEAELLKVLGHPIRLQVLRILEQEETCVCDLLRIIGVEQSNLSQHLKVLRKHNIVDTRREGAKMMYRLANPAVMPIAAAAEQAVQAYLQQMASLVKAHQH